MKISIIYPTRSRFDLFVKSTESLITNISSTRNLEILIEMDDDDCATIEKTKEYIKDKPYMFLNVGPRQGYRNLNKYVNAAALKSTGEYLMLWNDDCIMQTKNYDVVMNKYRGKFIIVNPLVVNHEVYCRNENRMLFPIIPREWINITGRWSNSGACDSWVELVSNSLHLSKYEDDIKIYHDRFDLTNNNADKTYEDGMQDKPFVFQNFFTPEQEEERSKDKKLIEDYVFGRKKAEVGVNFAFCTVAVGNKYVDFSKTLINQITSLGYSFFILTDQPEQYVGIENIHISKYEFPYFSYHHKRFIAKECLKHFETAIFLDADVVIKNWPDISIFQNAAQGFHSIANFGEIGYTFLSDDICRCDSERAFSRNTKYGKEGLALLNKHNLEYQKIFHETLANLEHILEGRWIIKRQDGKENKFFEIWDILAEFTEKKDIELGYFNTIGAGEGASMAIAAHNSKMTVHSTSPYTGFVVNNFISNYMEKMAGTKPWNIAG